MLFLDEPTESWHHLESCPCGDCMWYYIYKKPSVSPNTAEFPMLSHLLPSSLCPYCGFACKGLAEARGMWHTGGEVSQPLTQDTGTIPLIHPRGQWAKNLISQHGTTLDVWELWDHFGLTVWLHNLISSWSAVGQKNYMFGMHEPWSVFIFTVLVFVLVIVFVFLFYKHAF